VPPHPAHTHIKWHVRGYIALEVECRHYIMMPLHDAQSQIVLRAVLGFEIGKYWYQRWSCLEASYKGSVSSSFLT
jgi:hypothetical protein